MKYELITEKGNYALIIRGEKLEEYAVVFGLNKENGEWRFTCCYYNFGELYPIGKAEALAKTLDAFRARTESNYIPRDRLIEIATLAIDGLLQDSESSAMEYFSETMELSDEEREFFEVPLEEDFYGCSTNEIDDGDGYEDDSDRGCKDCPPDQCTGHCMSCYYRPV